MKPTVKHAMKLHALPVWISIISMVLLVRLVDQDAKYAILLHFVIHAYPVSNILMAFV